MLYIQGERGRRGGGEKGRRGGGEEERRGGGEEERRGGGEEGREGREGRRGGGEEGRRGGGGGEEGRWSKILPNASPLPHPTPHTPQPCSNVRSVPPPNFQPKGAICLARTLCYMYS